MFRVCLNSKFWVACFSFFLCTNKIFFFYLAIFKNTLQGPLKKTLEKMAAICRAFSLVDCGKINSIIVPESSDGSASNLWYHRDFKKRSRTGHVDQTNYASRKRKWSSESIDKNPWNLSNAATFYYRFDNRTHLFPCVLLVGGPLHCFPKCCLSLSL